jgi:hypothetical protein
MGKEEFEDEKRLHGKKAWLGYVRFFSMRSNFIFKHAKGLHTVRCRMCQVPIPPQVPRLDTDGSWGYFRSHFCAKHAIQELKSDIRDKMDKIDYLKENIVELKVLLEQFEKTAQKKSYQDIMLVCELQKKIEGRT